MTHSPYILSILAIFLVLKKKKKREADHESGNIEAHILSVLPSND